MAIPDAAWKDLLTSKQAFLETVVDPMIGWLDRYAAKRTLDLLEYQETNKIDGSLYEVGIYHGKYFSLLARSAALTGSMAIGIDLFDYLTPQRFREYFDEQFSPGNLAAVASNFRWKIIEGSSGDLSARTLLKELGSEARFISVDGSHEYDDVLWDLRVAEQVLAAAGIISVDDIINPICLGVAAATYNKKTPLGKRVTQYDIQNWTWDFLSHPSDPNYGELSDRFAFDINTGKVEREKRHEDRPLTGVRPPDSML